MKKNTFVLIFMLMFLVACSSEVQITMPASVFLNSDTEEIKATSVEKGIKDCIINDDGSVTYVMSNKIHKKMLKDYKKEVDTVINKFVEGEEKIASYKKIEYNDDLSVIDIYLDKDKISFFDTLASLPLSVSGSYYQALSGVAEDDIDVTINYIDNSTNEKIDMGNLNGANLNKGASEDQSGSDKVAESDKLETDLSETELELLLSEQEVRVLYSNYIITDYDNKTLYPDIISATIQNQTKNDIRNAVIGFVAWDKNNLPLKIKSQFGQGEFFKQVDYNDINLAFNDTYGNNSGLKIDDTVEIKKLKAVVVSYETFEGEKWENPYLNDFRALYEDKKLTSDAVVFDRDKVYTKEVKYHIGMDINELKQYTNNNMKKYDNFQIGDFSITKENDYITHEYKYNDKDTLKIITDKNMMVTDVELQYRAIDRTKEEMMPIYMTMMMLMMSQEIGDGTNGGTQEELLVITDSLNITKQTEERNKTYGEQRKPLTYISNDMKYERQKISDDYSIFSMKKTDSSSSVELTFERFNYYIDHLKDEFPQLQNIEYIDYNSITKEYNEDKKRFIYTYKCMEFDLGIWVKEGGVVTNGYVAISDISAREKIYLDCLEFGLLGYSVELNEDNDGWVSYGGYEFIYDHLEDKGTIGQRFVLKENE